MAEPLYSIVVPVYKSKDSLRQLYERIDSAFENIDGHYELILVDDCSRDGTWTVMKTLHNLDPRVKIVGLARNFGQHNALMCGFSFASGDFVITMDDDLQNPPEEIPRLIDAITGSELDVVYGLPRKKQHSLFKNTGSRVFLYLLSVIFRNSPCVRISSFRIVRRPIIDHIIKINTPNPLVGPLLLKVTDNIGTTTVDHHKRFSGRSTYSPVKLARQFLHGILYNSTLPLKAVFGLGTFCLCLCAALSTYYLLAYFAGVITVSGWTTLVLLTLFFSGVIMFSMGIVGEYLLRILQELSKTPQYVIRDKEM